MHKQPVKTCVFLVCSLKGNGTEGQGYKDCSGARRRRDTADEDEDFYDGDEDLPTEVSTILTIRLNPGMVTKVMP